MPRKFTAKQADYRDLPTLDLGEYLKGTAGATEKLASQLRHACEDIGFFFIVNHGIPDEKNEKIFNETKRFHALPEEDKVALAINSNQRGYIQPGGTLIKHSTYNKNTKFDKNATMVVATEYAEDNPYRKKGKRFYDENQWPDSLSGYREVVEDYMVTMTALGKKLLPLWAAALELPGDFFTPYFIDNYTYLRMAYYPPVPELEENEFGLGPHADTGFMTFLPQADVDGLEILDVEGNWFRPPKLDDAILVNTGQFLERWSNNRFRATPHRVIPPKDKDRYSVACFVNTAFEPVCECLPTCHGPENPPQYPTESYHEFYTWYMTNTYSHYGNENGSAT
ncbi:isopenicillin N synthase family dioxygenase [Pseudomonadota bacterium]